MRRVVLDTETTGMPASDGHRIIEIGCVEMNDREVTGSYYHQFVNPEREVDTGAFKVHGISDEFLLDKPVMSVLMDEFLDFIDGAELIIHNAAFDVGFLNNELKLLGRETKIEDICTIVDTVAMARKKYPGTRVSLDALVKKFGITSFNRDLHGALLDSEILAQVYLLMTGGQSGLGLSTATKSDDIGSHSKSTFDIHKVLITDDELQLHKDFFVKN